MLRRNLFRHLLKTPARSVTATSPIESLKAPKKFYKVAGIAGSETHPNEFEICLDNRRLKTPFGRRMTVSNRGLALAMAEEWNSQKDVIKREHMNLTNLANTAIDNPQKLSVSMIIEACLNFVITETLCYRSEEPAEAKYQAEKWDPVLKWAEDRFNVELPVTTGLSPVDVKKSTLTNFRTYLEQLPVPALFAVRQAVESSKSFVLTLAVVNKAIGVAEAAELARLEQNYQIERWGNVEWHHDIEHHDLVSQLAASSLYFHFVTETHQTILKRKK